MCVTKFVLDYKQSDIVFVFIKNLFLRFFLETVETHILSLNSDRWCGKNNRYFKDMIRYLSLYSFSEHKFSIFDFYKNTHSQTIFN